MQRSLEIESAADLLVLVEEPHRLIELAFLLGDHRLLEERPLQIIPKLPTAREPFLLQQEPVGVLEPPEPQHDERPVVERLGQRRWSAQ